ncbi:hypothetical protein K432DRAFT_413699 [Lepidopterella palustris CBS 459.81]|uniref:Cytochrome P450 n=1 Tax=Lepidopterella palustris CBS 459.81 TaxID=1314670 RepID=A0A8E2EJU8_9PEZI|nr:hypothetical protein K432DRAFT_413699 [Lepidopterella palustris CBS 459.81]
MSVPSPTGAVLISLAILLLLFGLLIWHSHLLHAKKCQKAAVKFFSDEPTVRRILSGTGLDDDNINMRPPLKSRAIPNARLIDTFGIDNAFTTSAEKHKTKFKTQTTLLLNRQKGDFGWDRLRDEARKLVQDDLNEHTVPLVPLVQTVTLRLTFAVLFNVDPQTITHEKASFIGHEINRLWLASKASGSAPKWAKQRKFHDTLLSILPNHNPLDRTQNPLNLILPAYETLWRVILRCFIEVVYLCTDTDSCIWRKELQCFFDNPTTYEPDELSALVIAKEALRLYPPTRRVYRNFLISPSPTTPRKGELIAADIEAYHRDPSIWGSEPKTFRPSRWSTVNMPNDRLLAFGAKPFLCPAYNDFGVKMIALLTAALAEGVGKDWALEGKKGVLPEPGQGPMEGGRTAYEDCILRKRKSCC